MEGLETEKPKECHFTLEIFNPRDKREENDMDNTFFLHGTKSAHFYSLRNLHQAYLKRWADANSGVVWPKISQANHFFYLI